MKLTKKDAFRVWFKWFFTPQACYNYERMMGLGFLDAMCPALGKLYAENLEGRKAAMARHAEFFNCEPTLGAAIVGLSVAMEEQIASGADIDGSAVTSIKTGLMGPLSGIGDSIMQGVLCPLLLAFAVELAIQGNVAAPVVYALVISAILVGLSYSFFQLGYRKGSDAILDMLENGVLNKVIAGAGVLGCMVLGGLVANFVSVKCGINIPQGSGDPFSLQTGLFDVLCPNILPLGLTLLCYKVMSKNVSTVKVMIGIVIVGVVGSLLGIFA